MVTVKVILKQDVPSLGSKGDIKQVAPGYFRNFLLPRGLAVEATKGQIRALETSSSTRAAQSARAKEQASGLVQQLEATTIQIPVRLGEQGRIYGSVTSKDIADQLSERAGVSIDRHKIELPEPLKSIGVHTVPIKVDQGVEAKIQVELVPETSVAEV
ncbi:MAG TPA: 50S ribosomal protein L9 [Chloroflexota bacterium]